MLDAVEKTADFTRKKMLAIRDLLNETLVYARENLPGRVYSKELIEMLFRHPPFAPIVGHQHITEKRTALVIRNIFNLI